MGVVAVIVCEMNDNSQIIMQAKKVDLDIFCSASAGFLLYIYWVVGVMADSFFFCGYLHLKISLRYLQQTPL